jgi:hypothetical protein
MTGRVVTGMAASGMAMLWIGWVAGALGVFAAAPVIAAAAVVGVVTAWALPRTPSVPVDAFTAIAVLIAVAAMAFAWPPGHVMQLQWDPAIYIQSGAVLAREGALAFELPVFHRLPRIIQELVATTGWHVQPYSGMVLNPAGEVVPVFYHGFPVWVAFLFSIAGLDGALAANIPLYGFAILLMFILVRRWYGPGWGLLAALLLAASPVMIWQSRFPTAELLAQVFIVGGWILLDRSWSDAGRGRGDAFMAGCAFGLAMVVRFDSLLVVVPLMVLLVSWWPDRSVRTRVVWVLVPMTLLALHAVVHAGLMGSPYFPRRSWVLAGLSAASGVLVVQALVIGWMRWWSPGWLLFSRRQAITVAGGWLGAMFVLGVIRPWIADADVWPVAWMVHPVVRWAVGPEAWNLTVLVAVAGGGMVFLSVLGLAGSVLADEMRPVRRMAVLVMMAVWLILMGALHHEREMMWICRRFVPVIVPALVLGVVASLHGLAVSFPLRPPARRFWIMVAVVALGVGWYTPLTRVAGIREFHGTKPGFAQLAGQLPENALVFADIPGVGAVLRTVYGRDALELSAPTMARRAVLMRWLPALKAGRPVYWVTPIPIDPSQEGSYILRGKNEFRSRIYDQPERTVPDRWVDVRSEFFIYQVRPYPEETSLP